MKLVTSTRRRPQSLNAVAAEIAAAVLVHVSLWLLLLSMLSIQLAPWAVAALVLLPALLYLVARIKGFGNFLPVYALFLPLLAALAGMRYFGQGFRELFNYLAKAVNGVHELALFPVGDGYPKGPVPSVPGQLALLLIAFFLAGLFAFAICRKVRPLAWAVTGLPMLVPLAAGLRPNTPSFIFFLVAATFYLILLETRSKGTARRLTWLNGEISAALLLFLLLLALLLSGFERSDRVEDLRQQIAAQVTDYRYAPKEDVDGMPKGDLNTAKPLQYEGKTVLTLETPNAFSMYLRGFSGDVFEHGRWVPLPAEAYFDNYSLTGPWVRSSYFTPAISLGQLLDLKWQVQTTQYEKGEREAMNLPRYPVTIRNELAWSDVMYAPYEVSAESKGLRRAELSQEGLKAEGIRGKRSYEFIVYQPLTKDYGNVSGKSIVGEDAPYNSLYEDAFAPTEKVYRAFVAENELEVPEAYHEQLESLSRSVVGIGATPSQAVLRIRTYFARNFTFSLNTPSVEAGEDPLLKFLDETRTGYDTHFATLAVLLLREAGIPARYAEGYLVSEELVTSVPKETEVTLEVPDKASHAWVELYQNGVGWVPVEVTPGYFETEKGSDNSGPGEQEVVEPEEVPPPEGGEDSSEDSGSSPSEEPDQTQEKGSSKALLLLPLLLLILLIPLVWDRVLRGRIARADSPETVERAFRYLMKIFRLWGLKPDELRPKELAPLFTEDREQYLHIIDLIYKETYSVEGLTGPEREEVCETVLDLTADRKQLRAARKTVRDRDKKNTDREEHHGK